MSSIGPQLPPPSPPKRKRSNGSLSPPIKQARTKPPPTTNDDEIDLQDSDSDSDFGPPAAPSTNIGPTPPPAQTQEENNRSASSSDSEDDYGPSLPSATTKRPTIGPTLPSADPTPQRDSWMLAPPTSTGYSERDPTRMRNRKFASKPSSGPPPAGDAPSIWTETPEEKLKRQRDALLGRTAADSTADGGMSSSRNKQQEERDRKIAESIEAQRGKSLYNEHAEKRRDGKGVKEGQEDDDDPSKRAFDREKDMAVGGKIGTAQRRELINKSANFGGRFQKGSFL